jgi:tetratricopeptide (TPR) repeat protein
MASSVNALLSRWDAAVDAAKRAYALDPRNPTAAIGVARILHVVRRFPEADEYSAKALALSPGNISFTLDRVINRISMGDLAGAKDAAHQTLLIADSTELAAFFALFQEMQWVLDEPQLRRIIAMTPAQFRNNRQQWALKVGATWNLLGDSARARAFGDSARIVAEAQLASFPNDAQLHELRARSLALMGRKPEAIEEADRALKMRETALDASTGPYVRYQAARVFIQAGAYDRALDLIEPLLTANYSDLSPAWLGLEPVFRPLRGNPRFEKLLKK